MPGKTTGRHESKKLSAAFVRSVREPGRYMDGGGLFLFVDASGGKRWGQRIVIRGRRTDLGLGGVDVVTLAEARVAADANRRLARAGGDPLAEKRAKAETPTFAEAVEQYLEVIAPEFRSEKHLKQWRSTLDTYAGPVLGRMLVSDIALPDVLRVLQPIWTDKTETARRLRGRIESVLDWASVSGHRTGDNPARWRGNLDKKLPKPNKVAEKDNQPALALADLPRWWRALAQRDGIAAQALAFLTLTAARSGEVRGMAWDEVDMDRALWVIPATRMKMKREHRVPLTTEAVAMLRALPRLAGNPYVFFAPRGGMLSDMSISAVMRRMQEAEVKAGRPGWLDPVNKRPAVPHGLRSSFRQWAAEQGVDRDMAEMALAHRVGDATERAYQRSDMLERRRALAAAWARFVKGEAGGNVVDLAGKRAG
ncbi:MAG: tyrosine-type recombinase/integrase [Limimaricola sp.]|uniref:tyrosine-type recombinase/integrase n=1 Tax=Limimaricola sp. TaxID=2211665 RepID=UPI001D1B7520|nr:site-specific integrase [Limimaricola sp.]MBI1416845.1 tyrosine-type recombinase/integrase [Limimaricola sp.]